jgi:hypothetical protein
VLDCERLPPVVVFSIGSVLLDPESESVLVGAGVRLAQLVVGSTNEKKYIENKVKTETVIKSNWNKILNHEAFKRKQAMENNSRTKMIIKLQPQFLEDDTILKRRNTPGPVRTNSMR